ncbi:Rab GDP dissociation inhibitor alpha [Phlyctochytrium planicorne]|nr:Rab GDP dissociation inhibitor alpha [Phlyctochytrium planicorne]
MSWRTVPTAAAAVLPIGSASTSTATNPALPADNDLTSCVIRAFVCKKFAAKTAFKRACLARQPTAAELLAKNRQCAVKRAVGMAECCLKALYKLILEKLYKVDVDATGLPMAGAGGVDGEVGVDAKVAENHHAPPFAHVPAKSSFSEHDSIASPTTSMNSSSTAAFNFNSTPSTSISSMPPTPTLSEAADASPVTIPSSLLHSIANSTKAPANIPTDVLLCLRAHAPRVRLMATLAANDQLKVPGCPHVLRYALALVKRMLDMAARAAPAAPVEGDEDPCRVNGQVATCAGLPPSLKSPARLLLAGLMLAHASLSDKSISTVTWARVYAGSCGISAKDGDSGLNGLRGELAGLKMDALKLLEFRTWVSVEEYCLPLLNETYDVIVLGTGLTECILSGLLSVEGKKVLHIDRNDYYGGASASLNLTQLYQKYRSTPSPEKFGRDRDYNVDLIPKFAMASGEFVNILYHTDVTRYLEFRQVAGSFVFRDGKISKVPASQAEALASPLMSLLEKRNAQLFFEFIQGYDFGDSKTHQGLDLNTATMAQVYAKFNLESGTQDFIGHALALHTDDAYLNEPARDTYEKICLYMNSVARYGKSPYIYPMYGLGELPQGFARLSAIYGGTYMLSKPVDGIVYNDAGKVVGVTSEGETAKAPIVIGDPSYFPEKVKKTGRVIRAICILDHPVPGTGDADSAQIVVPQKQVGREHDIYIAAISSAHSVCAKDHFIAIVSTIATTENPEAEIQPGLDLLGTIADKFIIVDDLFEPIEDGKKDGVFISTSYDATSHFESVCQNVKSLYERISGGELKVEGKVRKVVDEEEE